MFKKLLILLVLSTISYTPIAAETWRGVIIEPENRCSLYDKKAPYPYTGSYFDWDTDTDLEYIVVASEGHESR
ncbi:hypothetical protein PSOS111911_07985 [Pseudoalteromonas ostreae]